MTGGAPDGGLMTIESRLSPEAAVSSRRFQAVPEQRLRPTWHEGPSGSAKPTHD